MGAYIGLYGEIHPVRTVNALIVYRISCWNDAKLNIALLPYGLNVGPCERLSRRKFWATPTIIRHTQDV